MNINIFKYYKKYNLESGKSLNGFEIAYSTIGKLNKEKSNVVWITHALTGNSNPLDWWPGIIGKGKLFDPEKHFIICANVLGSPYGSTNPLSKNPTTGSPYYHLFPQLTVRDMVNAFELLRQHLHLPVINTLIGGSLGGQQALEWAVLNPDVVKNLILIATNAKHSPWGIAFNESQRLAIKADRTWYNQSDDAGLKGLKAARAIALLSYRNYKTYRNTQSESSNEKTDDFKAISYQNYQGEKFIKRFNAFSYWVLSKAMDSHNIGRGRGQLEEVLKSIKANTLVIGISTDILFPVNESLFLAQNIKGASFEIIDSVYGHDGFLIETQQLTKIIKNFLKTSKNKKQNVKAY
jgi:homoserine O-acetyltransferase